MQRVPRPEPGNEGKRANERNVRNRGLFRFSITLVGLPLLY